MQGFWGAQGPRKRQQMKTKNEARKKISAASRAPRDLSYRGKSAQLFNHVSHLEKMVVHFILKKDRALQTKAAHLNTKGFCPFGKVCALRKANATKKM